MRRVIILSQDLLDPEKTLKKTYEYEIDEPQFFNKSFEDFGISPQQFGEYAVSFGSLPNGIDYECRVIPIINSSTVVTYLETFV